MEEVEYLLVLSASAEETGLEYRAYRVCGFEGSAWVSCVFVARITESSVDWGRYPRNKPLASFFGGEASPARRDERPVESGKEEVKP